jgi:poly(A) polymerase
MDPADPQRREGGSPREAAEKVVRVLQDAGHVAYFAGGCVRDMLRDAEPTDFDVATDARPDRVLDLFHRARLVGEAFGVALVRVYGVEVEVATFRTEWGYRDGRHPDHVEFSDAEHDARRRDFTINGLFYDPVADRVYDYVGGRADLDRGIVRAIGDPDDRFGEDYLRMLRAVRFAARLGYVIEPDTAAAIERHAERLGRISRERIGGELRLMLTRPSRGLAVRLMQRFGLDGPALNEPPTDAEAKTVEALEPTAAFPTALAAWALDRHAAALPMPDAIERMKLERIVRRWREALALSNTERDAVRSLLSWLPELWRWPTLRVARRKRLLARGDWTELWRLGRAVDAAKGGLDVPAIEREAAALIEQGVAPAPLITGDDLVAAGLSPGPRFKRLLDAAYDAQLEGRVATPAEALRLALERAEEGEP